jgi:acyl carrier protein
MFEEVKEILIEQLYLDGVEVRPESRIKADLGADSLDILQLLMTIQEKKGIVIPDEALASFETVQDVVDYLESRDK